MHLTLFYVQRVNNISFFFFLWRSVQCFVHGLSFHGASRYHSDTLTLLGLHQTSGQTLTPLLDNTQQSQETDIQTLGGIRNSNPSKRTDPRLRPPCHRERFFNYIIILSGDLQHIAFTGAI